ncbi:hypothetical protein [Staphylococcus aureus]|uniref:hypothetical protein n=1 Tax=Staphylococcus aureus TaxID=1280 RepID=UPI00141A251B|nr:hypothetical protein [Staphylococcus aureus]
MEKRQQRGLFTVPGLLLAFCSHVLSCVVDRVCKIYRGLYIMETRIGLNVVLELEIAS